jgi:hypothetical protein
MNIYKGKNVRKHLNFEYRFVVRRYGHGSTVKFFLWVEFHVPGTPWQEYGGDPWMKSRLNKKEVAEVLGNITLRILPVGTRVQTHNGPATILGVQEHGLFTAKLDYFNQQTLGLSPFMIERVL